MGLLIVGSLIGVGGKIDGVIGFECEILFVLRRDVLFREEFSGFEGINRLHKWYVVVDKFFTAQFGIHEIITDSFSCLAHEQCNILYVFPTSDIVLTDIIS